MSSQDWGGLGGVACLGTPENANIYSSLLWGILFSYRDFRLTKLFLVSAGHPGCRLGYRGVTRRGFREEGNSLWTQSQRWIQFHCFYQNYFWGFSTPINTRGLVLVCVCRRLRMLHINVCIIFVRILRYGNTNVNTCCLEESILNKKRNRALMGDTFEIWEWINKMNNIRMCKMWGWCLR